MNPSAEFDPALAPALAARLSDQAGRALQDLPSRVHPAWTAAMGADPGLLRSGGAQVLNTALLARFDLRWPDLSAARHAVELAWLLPPDQVARLCAARVLFTWRGVLARTVDAGLRRAARARIGAGSFDVLVAMPGPRHGDPPPAMLDDVLLPLGWAWLKSALPWRDPRARRLVELMLPPVAPPAAARRAEADDGRFLSALPDLFPEHAWLFGSEPATLTSG